MAISQRLRFEILKRDGHRCRYCGITAAEAVIEVDAVMPEVLGGSHKDPANLVAACGACNGGKSSSHPDAPPVADVPEDALRWGRAIKTVRREMLSRLEARDAYRADVVRAWEKRIHPHARRNGYIPRLNGECIGTVDECLVAGVPFRVLEECMDVALDVWSPASFSEWPEVFCRLAQREIAKLQRAAYAIVTAEPVAT